MQREPWASSVSPSFGSAFGSCGDWICSSGFSKLGIPKCQVGCLSVALAALLHSGYVLRVSCRDISVCTHSVLCREPPHNLVRSIRPRMPYGHTQLSNAKFECQICIFSGSLKAQTCVSQSVGAVAVRLKQGSSLVDATPLLSP